MTNIHLLGVPMEEGAGRRGCIMGPAAYRTAGLAEELAALGHEVTDLGDARRDDVGVVETEHTHLKFLPEVAGWTRCLHAHAFAQAQGDALPIYMGGDHALALGTVTGHVAAAADMGAHIFCGSPATPPHQGWTGSTPYHPTMLGRSWDSTTTAMACRSTTPATTSPVSMGSRGHCGPPLATRLWWV